MRADTQPDICEDLDSVSFQHLVHARTYAIAVLGINLVENRRLGAFCKVRGLHPDRVLLGEHCATAASQRTSISESTNMARQGPAAAFAAEHAVYTTTHVSAAKAR